MAWVEALARRREENSQCLSLAMVRKASRPSMRSQGISWSGSTVLAMGELHTDGGWRRTTKNTCGGRGREERGDVGGGRWRGGRREVERGGGEGGGEKVIDRPW